MNHQISDYQAIQPQITQLRQKLAILQTISNLNKRQKSQLATKDLLLAFLKLTNIPQLQYVKIPFQILLQQFALLLNSTSYQIVEKNSSIGINGMLFDQLEIYILFNGSVTKHSQQKISYMRTFNQMSRKNISSERHSMQRIIVHEKTRPRCFFFQSNENLKIKTCTTCQFIKIQRFAWKQFIYSLKKYTQQYNITFLSRVFHLNLYEVKQFKMQCNISHQIKSRHSQISLSPEHIYIIEKGHILVKNQTFGNYGLVVTQGAILNLVILFPKNTKKQKYIVQNEVSFIRLTKQLFLTIFHENEWFKDHIINLNISMEDQRKKYFMKNQQFPIPQMEVDFNRQYVMSDKIMKRFREILGKKKKQNRFRVGYQTSRSVEITDMNHNNFIHNVYPFGVLVKSQQKIVSRNIQQRSKQPQINMLPAKDSKNYQAMKRRYHDQKVKQLKVMKRAQNQIKTKSYISTQTLELAHLLKNALFQEQFNLIGRPFYQKASPIKAKTKQYLSHSNTFEPIQQNEIQMIEEDQNIIKIQKSLKRISKIPQQYSIKTEKQNKIMNRQPMNKSYATPFPLDKINFFNKEKNPSQTIKLHRPKYIILHRKKSGKIGYKKINSQRQ